MRIAFLGDIALFGKNSFENFDDFKRRTSSIKTELNKCDRVVANLETPLTKASSVVGGKSAYIKGKPSDVELLRYLGITHVSLANNHTFDYKAVGLVDTLKTLDKAGIRWYGVNNKGAIIRSKDCMIHLHGYCCYSTNARGMERNKPFVNVLDPKKVEQDISSDIKEGYLPVFSCHWGQEHVHYPNYDHVELSRKLCSDREIIIHGHHPHVIQGIEKIGDSIIAYSLGNFCFDDVYTSKSSKPLIKLSKDNQESFIWIVDIKDNHIKGQTVIPFSFENDTYDIIIDINKKIDEWSDFLNVDKDTFIEKRSKDLNEYLSKRKQSRDFEWYIKRMNPESARMILNARHNLKRYNSLIKEYIRKI